MLKLHRVTAVNQSGNLCCVTVNMAILKVLCLIGFVLLSSSYARKHEAGHGHHSRGFHRYKHILKRHLSADQIFRQGQGSKRSERVEESSHVWLQNGSQRQTKRRHHEETNSVFPNKGHPSDILFHSRSDVKPARTTIVLGPGGNKGPTYEVDNTPNEVGTQDKNKKGSGDAPSDKADPLSNPPKPIKGDQSPNAIPGKKVVKRQGLWRDNCSLPQESNLHPFPCH